MLNVTLKMTTKSYISPTGNDFEICGECDEQIAWTYEFGWRHSEDNDEDHDPISTGKVDND